MIWYGVECLFVNCWLCFVVEWLTFVLDGQGDVRGKYICQKDGTGERVTASIREIKILYVLLPHLYTVPRQLVVRFPSTRIIILQKFISSVLHRRACEILR